MNETAKPARKHRKLKVVLIVLLAVLAGFVALMTFYPNDRPRAASDIPHRAAITDVAIDEYLDPRKAKQLFETGERAFDLLVVASMMPEVRFFDDSEEPTSYYDSPAAALEAARETHGEDSLYQRLSEPIFLLDGPPYGGNRTAIATCLTTREEETRLVFVFFDRQHDMYSNPISTQSVKADYNEPTWHYGLLSYASEEEKIAETFFEYLSGDKYLFIANAKTPVYIGASTNPAVSNLSVLGRNPDETAVYELNSTTYYLWMYRTFDFNRYLIDSRFDFNEFYLPELVNALEVEVPE